MKNVIVLSLISFAIVGCVSSSYKLSVPPVEVKGNAKYCLRQQFLARVARKEGVYDRLYSHDSTAKVMPLQVSWREQAGERQVDFWASLFGTLTLGVYPFHTSITSRYNVTVNGPQGPRSGQFEIVKDNRVGWLASVFVIGSDAHHFWDNDPFMYTPEDLAEIGIARKILELANSFDYDAYVMKELVKEMSNTKDKATISTILQRELGYNIGDVAERRLNEIAEKTALEMKHREEVKAQVALFEENQDLDSIIALCNEEISNAEFLGTNELVDIKENAKRGKDRKACREKELQRISRVKICIAEKSSEEKWDDVITICEWELRVASGRPGYRKEDLEFWRATRNAAIQSRAIKIKSKLDELLNAGHWKEVLERCDHELGNKDGVADAIFLDVKARVKEVWQQSIDEKGRDGKWDEVIAICEKELAADDLSDEGREFFASTASNAERQVELVRICSVTNSLQEKLDKKMWSDVMKVCGDELREIGTGRGRSQEDLLVWEHFKKLAIDGERVQRDARLTSMGLRFNGESLLSVCTTPSKLKINDVYVNDSSEFRIAQFMLDEHNARVRVPDNYSYILVKTIDAYADDDRLEPDTWFAYKGLRQYKTIFGAPVTIRYFEQVSKQ